jgi:hypothetical protein
MLQDEGQASHDPAVAARPENLLAVDASGLDEAFVTVEEPGFLIVDFVVYVPVESIHYLEILLLASDLVELDQSRWPYIQRVGIAMTFSPGRMGVPHPVKSGSRELSGVRPRDRRREHLRLLEDHIQVQPGLAAGEFIGA